MSALSRDNDNTKNPNTYPRTQSSNGGYANHSLNLVLFGSAAAVKAGDDCLLPDYSGRSVLKHLAPVDRKIAGRDVSVINMIGLHEADYRQESMDIHMGQILGVDVIHAFLYMLPPQSLTDKDKMAVEWLQKVFGTSSLHVLIIVFTYENEGDCDSIIDDLKRNTVLEQLVEKSGGRYFTSNKTLNNEREMKELLQKIDLMVSENNAYAASSFSEQLKIRQTMSNSGEHRNDSGGPAEEADRKDSTKHEKEEQCQETPEETRRKKRSIEDLFQRLNLSTELGNLSTSDILKIDTSSCQPRGAKVERGIAHTFLYRLFMTDYRARYISITEKNRELNKKNAKSKESDERDAFAAIFQKKGMKNEVVEKQFQIHPMDIQMATFYSADEFLRQHILTKLSMCQYALPLLVPNPLTSKIEFPLWAFRQVRKSWKTIDVSGKEKIYNEPVYNISTPMVSVFRLGPVSVSKSQLINNLINERHSTFFHRHCQGSSRTRLLMDGVVEIAWYCPSGRETDHFPECVAVCNVHGDGKVCLKQLNILLKVASVNVVFLPKLDENASSVGILKTLYGCPVPLICLLAEDDTPLEDIEEGNFRMGLKDRNQSDIVQELKMAINNCLSQKKFKLEDVSKQTGIEVDEDNTSCRKGKEAAYQINGLFSVNKLSSIKEKFLPCQGKLWHEWCQKNKDLYRLHGNLEQQVIRIKEEMAVIRSKQQKAGSSDLMRLFLGAMESLPIDCRKYFIKWTSIVMDSQTSKTLVKLHYKYDEKWKEVLRLKEKDGKSKKLMIKQDELEEISDQLNAATFGLEHILREMGQMYEAEVSVRAGKGVNTKLPKMAAELMLSGHPLELMDGDAAHIPITWINAVLDEVIEIIGDKKIFVLSVLGIQSTGKSTMLNAMFGLQFAVSAGRCTRGAFMQLVSMTEESRTKFDYILVVDTEGLRALELAGKSTIHHDNELATFVIGLGHMTLINIFGENPAEMQDIIQIAVQAFLRMKKVRLSPSCVFVHQNVADITAGEKNMDSKRRLQDKLDDMAQLAAKEEDGEAKCFNDVIAFDIRKDVKYFTPLWEGSPPMAPPNPSYSENVQDLKETILQKAQSSNIINFAEFKMRISDLWNALLNENFVFSFKNTLEIAVYRKLEAEYVKWTWSLREAMLLIENKLHNRIENDNLDTITAAFLSKGMQTTYKDVEKTMASYFDEHRDKEILAQWRGRFVGKIDEVHSDLVRETKTKLNDLIQQKKTRKKLDERKQDYQMTLFKKSKDLATTLMNKQGDKSEEALKEFNTMWESWLHELDLPRVKDCNIWEDVVSVLSDMGYERPFLNERIKPGGFKKITEIGDYSDYVRPIAPPSKPSEQKKKQSRIKTICGNAMQYLGLKNDVKTQVLTAEDQGCIRALTQSSKEETGIIVKNYLDQATSYNKTYFQAIIAAVKTKVNEYEEEVKERFTLTKAFKLDLLLYVSDVAKEQFAKIHSNYQKANDVFIYLENQKGQFYKVFESFLEGAKSSTVLGNFICSKLELSIRQAVYDQTAIDLVAEMQSNCPALNGSRNNLEGHILHSLAEEENFDKFLQYINNPKEHFKSFITEQVQKYIATVKNPRLLSKIQRHLKLKTSYAIAAAQSATESVKTNAGDADMWMKYFSEELKDELQFAEKFCVDDSEITDFDFLFVKIRDGLQNISESLSKSLSQLSFLKTELFRKKPDEILIQHFCKCCWVQCPFCKAICTHTFEDHQDDHKVPFHRTNGLNGWYFRNTTNLAVDFCTTAVASNHKFYPSHHSTSSIPYKEYKKGGPRYANWSITPDVSELPYWKWFMCRFKTDLEKHYKKTFEGHGEIPKEWMQCTKEQALKSLDAYILSNSDLDDE